MPGTVLDQVEALSQTCSPAKILQLVDGDSLLRELEAASLAQFVQFKRRFGDQKPNAQLQGQRATYDWYQSFYTVKEMHRRVLELAPVFQLEWASNHHRSIDWRVMDEYPEGAFPLDTALRYTAVTHQILPGYRSSEPVVKLCIQKGYWFSGADSAVASRKEFLVDAVLTAPEPIEYCTGGFLSREVMNDPDVMKAFLHSSLKNAPYVPEPMRGSQDIIDLLAGTKQQDSLSLPVREELEGWQVYSQEESEDVPAVALADPHFRLIRAWAEGDSLRILDPAHRNNVEIMLLAVERFGKKALRYASSQVKQNLTFRTALFHLFRLSIDEPASASHPA